MKICFWGLGSIGQRHLKNVVKILDEYNINMEIHALRKTQKPLEDDIKNLITCEFFDEKDLDVDYDISFITNPTNLHFSSIMFMKNKSKHMFIEKPIFDSSEYDINHLKLGEEGIYYVAGPLKYTRVVQRLKGILADERVYSIRAICSSYLPEWRPGADYRNIYSARKEEGGGVSIDLIHEWDYITYLFGFPQEVLYLNGKFSHLEIDSDDIAAYIAKYQDKLVEVHLDYFGRVPRREIEILTGNGIIVGDFINKKISFSDQRESICFLYENNEIYIDEMRNFIDKVLSYKKGENNIEHAYKLLKLANGRL